MNFQSQTMFTIQQSFAFLEKYTIEIMTDGIRLLKTKAKEFSPPDK